MTTADALLAAILRHQDEDTPRLMYADEIEAADPARAAFIRDTVWMAANHTDCPVRLADLKAGRPVPLRCGHCGYCRTRRRAEAYCARHRWLDVHSYAVCFEPTPLDGDIPTGPGLTIVVRRGFVEEVRCDLATLFGGDCENCAGSGVVGKQEGWAGPCPDCGGQWEPKETWGDRGYSPGTGRAEGLAKAIFAAHPVTRVVLTDLQPTGPVEHGPQIGCYFYPRRDVGDELWPHLQCDRKGVAAVFAVYFTRAAAIDALSAACVALGRERAGLT